MADTSKPVPSLSEAQQSEAVAPSSLKGWGALQRQVNVSLPATIKRAMKLLNEADAVLIGKGG